MEPILPDSCLAVFVDDTGHELLNDPVQKVFGLGGCAVMASHLDAVVREPWKKVRRVVAGSPDAPLHAAEIVRPTQQQLDAVNDFFRAQPLARFGAACSVETDFDCDITPLWTVADSLKRRILDIAQWQPFMSVEIIFEHSERLAPKIEQVFGTFGLEVDGKPVPVELSWMQKLQHEPALEVADFLANAVGSEVRHRLAGRPGFAKNFEAFFHGVDRRLVSFMNVSRVAVNQS